MAKITLILGESGTGKTASLRNFKSNEIALVNVAGKPLPFRTKFETLDDCTDYSRIAKFLANTKAKIVVIDDFQYMMSFQYMRRIRENGWDKFNDIQSDAFNLIECAKKLPDDVTVYFLSHIETKEDGRQKIKTIGKMLDEKITIEGMFTTVLKTYVADGKYFFLTQNSGMDTVKSPIGMFPSFAIDNDLKYVDEKVRNYYEMEGAKTDAEMAQEDAAKSTDEVEQAPNGRVKRARTRAGAQNQAQKPETVEPEQESAVEETETVELPFTINGESITIPKDELPRQRRTRKVRE